MADAEGVRGLHINDRTPESLICTGIILRKALQTVFLTKYMGEVEAAKKGLHPRGK